MHITKRYSRLLSLSLSVQPKLVYHVIKYAAETGLIYCRGTGSEMCWNVNLQIYISRVSYCVLRCLLSVNSLVSSVAIGGFILDTRCWWQSRRRNLRRTLWVSDSTVATPDVSCVIRPLSFLDIYTCFYVTIIKLSSENTSSTNHCSGGLHVASLPPPQPRLVTFLRRHTSVTMEPLAKIQWLRALSLCCYPEKQNYESWETFNWSAGAIPQVPSLFKCP